MNKNRLTLEELKELKPSFENPIKLVCDDGYFTSGGSVIKVVGIHNDRMAVIDKWSSLSTMPVVTLKHYPSFKKEREKMELKPYWVDGDLILMNKNLASVVKECGKSKLAAGFSPDVFDIIPAKGIESVWRHTDDWSVCDG